MTKRLVNVNSKEHVAKCATCFHVKFVATNEPCRKCLGGEIPDGWKAKETANEPV